MTIVAKAWAFFFLCLSLVILVVYLINPSTLFARNITQYKDTISDSAPEFASNHTLAFRLGTTISPGAYIEVTTPTGFEVLGTSTFVAERNVELYVNGALRDSSDTLSASTDLVEIFPGTPGMISTKSVLAESVSLESRSAPFTYNSTFLSATNVLVPKTSNPVGGVTSIYAPGEIVVPKRNAKVWFEANSGAESEIVSLYCVILRAKRVEGLIRYTTKSTSERQRKKNAQALATMVITYIVYLVKQCPKPRLVHNYSTINPPAWCSHNCA